MWKMCCLNIQFWSLPNFCELFIQLSLVILVAEILNVICKDILENCKVIFAHCMR